MQHTNDTHIESVIRKIERGGIKPQDDPGAEKRACLEVASVDPVEIDAGMNRRGHDAAPRRYPRGSDLQNPLPRLDRWMSGYGLKRVALAHDIQ